MANSGKNLDEDLNQETTKSKKTVSSGTGQRSLKQTQRQSKGRSCLGTVILLEKKKKICRSFCISDLWEKPGYEWKPRKSQDSKNLNRKWGLLIS